VNLQTSEKQQGIRIGDLTVLALPNTEILSQRKHQFLAWSYRVTETPHFLVCQKASSVQTVVMHVFTQHEIDADLICFVEDELSPFRIFTSAKAYGSTLFAVLASTFPSPRNQGAVWHLFCLNSLEKFRHLLSCPPQKYSTLISHITSFAEIYRRVFELYCGQSFLDVGSSFGFLPILLAQNSDLSHIVACDNNPDILNISSEVAAVTDAQHIAFTCQDVLTEDFASIGRFDTVTAIHVLEHVTEQQLRIALAHLLQVTAQRLIIAVPYEENIQTEYSHYQTFTQEKLATCGKWCIEMLKGKGRYWCEEVMGGMLVVEPSQEKENT